MYVYCILYKLYSTLNLMHFFDSTLCSCIILKYNSFYIIRLMCHVVLLLLISQTFMVMLVLSPFLPHFSHCSNSLVNGESAAAGHAIFYLYF
ncbi:hypothetical protein VNO80_26428 [Phaseolus coccineus]|uniref:Uncharacterized protein n=1 Tax=Phaseolus coccineus TaxID=3886 RepID=A0AAN9QGN4_PHACN